VEEEKEGRKERRKEGRKQGSLSDTKIICLVSDQSRH
jgi:hypothetical protein